MCHPVFYRFGNSVILFWLFRKAVKRSVSAGLEIVQNFHMTESKGADFDGARH